MPKSQRASLKQISQTKIPNSLNQSHIWLVIQELAMTKAHLNPAQMQPITLDLARGLEAHQIVNSPMH
jgi:hypothetical protein